MKKFFVLFVTFTALFLVVSCGDGKKGDDSSDTGEIVTDEDAVDIDPADAEPAGDTDTPDDPDTTPEDTDKDEADTAADNDPDTSEDTDSSADDDTDTAESDPCEDDPCGNVAHSTGECTADGGNFSCECESAYDWNGTECGLKPEFIANEDVPVIPEDQDNTENAACDYETFVEHCEGNVAVRCSSGVDKLDCTGEGEGFKCLAVAKEFMGVVYKYASCFEPCENVGEKMSICYDDYTESYMDQYSCKQSSKGNVILWDDDVSCDSECSEDGTNCEVTPLEEGFEGYCDENNVLHVPSYDGRFAKSVFCSNAGQLCAHGETCAAGEDLCAEDLEGTWNDTTDLCEVKKECGDIPENSEWNTKSKYTAEYEMSSGEWSPLGASEATPDYSTEAGTCHFKCYDGYLWNAESGTCETSESVCVAAGGVWKETYCITLKPICTGQTKCFGNGVDEIACSAEEDDDFPGQDAYYATLGYCKPQNYTVKSYSNGQAVLDNNTGLLWQQTMQAGKTWSEADAYCRSLNIGGFEDWRLPTIKELSTIAESNEKYSQGSKKLNTDYFPDNYDGSWWSSTFVHGSDVSVFVFTAGSGYVNSGSTSSSLPSRCVRGEFKLPEVSEFVESTPDAVSGEVVVTDTTTGLVWQKNYESGKTWQEALQYCAELNYAGSTDWRLPNKNELSTIINSGKSYPKTDFPEMPDTLNLYFWTSTSFFNVVSKNHAYVVLFAPDVYVQSMVKTDNQAVKCVRTAE